MTFIDLHTHTVASGHGTTDTIADLAKAAASKGMRTLGVSDHGPRTPGAAAPSYLRSLRLAPRERAGVRMLYGAEVNILDGGALDLPDEVLAGLDYVIASMHCPPRRVMLRDDDKIARQAHGDDGTVRQALGGDGFYVQSYTPLAPQALREANTADYLAAIANPYVRILGHCDNTQFPCDYERIADACAAHHVIVELNEASLTPGGYHQLSGVDTRENYRALLRLCRERSLPVLLSSDSHGRARIGEVGRCEALAREAGYPRALLVNENPALLETYRKQVSYR